jgi:N-acetylglucosaminyl-diphospho-decaprenol L-rhamnosyltransferase
MTRVLVVVVNFRTPDLTVQCLASVAGEREDLPGLEAVVVDNASGDGSADRIRSAIAAAGYGDWATLHESPRNGGFAFGNNEGIRPALQRATPPDYVLLLNSDTYVRRGAIGALVRFLESHPDAGIACSRLEDPDGTWQQSRFRFPTFWSEVEHGFRFGPVTRLLRRHIVPLPQASELLEVDWAAGASMLIRREVFERVGLMDDHYFLYYEETDFCLQSKRAGFRVWYVPDSRVVHLVGRSTGVTQRESLPKRLPRYWFASRWRYFRKNHGRLYAIAATVAFTLGFATWRLRRFVTRVPDRDPPRMLTDFVRYGFREG